MPAPFRVGGARELSRDRDLHAITVVEGDAKSPPSHKGLYVADLGGKAPDGEHRWCVHCLDARTGQALWKREAFRGEPASTIHYENYPVRYRCNTPADVARFARAFRACELVSFSRVGQCTYYYPRCFHRLADRLDRRAIRLGKPGALLAVRAVK